MIIAVAGMLLDAAAQSTFIYLLRPLVDDAFNARSSGIAAWLPWAIFTLVVMRGLGNFSGVYSVEWVGRRVVADLRQRLFSHYLFMPNRFFQEHSAGSLISRLTYNTEQVAHAATNGAITLVRDSLTTLGLFTVMLLQSPMLTATLLVMAPVVAIVVRVVSRRFRHISHRIQDTMGEVTQVAEEAVNAYQVVKIYGGEEQEQKRFQRANEDSRRLQLRLTANQLSSSTIIQWCAGVALVAILWLATQSPWTGEISAGQFMSVVAAMMAVIAPLKRLATIHAVVQKGVAAADSIFSVLDEACESPGGDHAPEQALGEVRMAAVSFRYPRREMRILDNIHLHLRPGMVTALVGRSGSGKTTLAALLARFYDVSDGAIELDGMDIRHWQRKALRRQIAYVGQDVVLFNDTIERNIAYGELHQATAGQIEAAARAAHVMEFARRLPDGLQTRVGDRGHLLSGGERQRLAIARALLKNAPILILDEATSALDNESERYIQEALTGIMQQCTTLVIAHRLSTVEQADQILVLDHGRILQRGTHASLLRQGGLYADLYHRRFSEETKPKAEAERSTPAADDQTS